MLIELHCHTDLHSGCSIIDPETLVRQAIKQGLQGVVITEHHYQWNTEDITRLRERAEVDNTFLILAGQEVETDIGHVLVYGADQSISDRIELNELRQRYPSAALVWAHPFRYGKNPDGKALLNPFLDGVEIFSMNHSTKENCRGLTSWHEHK
ncbi:MAG: PHP domain-containing protein, partial [bacterium]|nr:PHP domain-containing protein [bacterium]